MRRYLDTTRTHTYSLLFALPLLVLYELGAMMIGDGRGGGMRNGADVLLRTLLATGGVQGTLAFTAALAVGAAVIIALERRRKKVPLRGDYFAGMMGESVLYALVFGFIIAAATQVLLGGMVRFAADGGVASMPLFDGIVLSLGAGIYEELLFRVILTGGLFALLLAAGVKRPTAGVVAVIVSAIIFSWFHYIGPYAYKWELNSFVFRMLAGLAFSALYMTRGFGVAAWTHALYDVFLVIAGAAAAR
ncbi:CPBP family intramembrane glutamic endopeptidase [Longimicrobium sp.]|uniref:CPBP family intramembrane glutamic endopeptidase n=1 Tax=Longimicrobium sp. TaxID=2029185 RepID=UPI002E332C01|nr:CPBP family intramembrane glutamic endopeptidase [Longimicrobium sp.]HEX6037801.1 CPBP family intramembrane glutamic endopeptidase [Longimicrobium sp.]